MFRVGSLGRRSSESREASDPSMFGLLGLCEHIVRNRPWGFSISSLLTSDFMFISSERRPLITSFCRRFDGCRFYSSVFECWRRLAAGLDSRASNWATPEAAVRGLSRPFALLNTCPREMTPTAGDSPFI